MRRHQIGTKEPCPVGFCDRSFDRYDKLRDHLRIGHVDTEEATCPYPDCGISMPFLLLIQHCQKHDIYANLWFKTTVGKALLAAPALTNEQNLQGLRSCPIPSCKHQKKRISFLNMKQHLLEHGNDERRTNSSFVSAAGYTSDIEIMCPVCGATVHGQIESFEDHVLYEHTVLVGMSRETGKLRESFWHHRYHLSQFFDCLWRKERGLDIWNETLLLYTSVAPSQDLFEYRWTILRHWPMFALHPVFDDLMPPRGK